MASSEDVIAETSTPICSCVITADGHNFRLILAWLRLLLRLILAAILERLAPPPRLRTTSTINT